MFVGSTCLMQSETRAAFYRSTALEILSDGRNAWPRFPNGLHIARCDWVPSVSEDAAVVLFVNEIGRANIQFIAVINWVQTHIKQSRVPNQLTGLMLFLCYRFDLQW